jgi:hypothetical protein
MADVERRGSWHACADEYVGGSSHEMRPEGKASPCSPLRVAVELCVRGILKGLVLQW